jgi:uncharacterized protein
LWQVPRVERREVSFISQGEQLAAWLYEDRVKGPGPLAPVVVMAHGLGGVREAGLAPFAERFAAAGLRVMVFDYAGFGGSTGEPRQVVDIERQLGDWRAAIGFARGLDGVDADRVAIWGTSLGGGHAITIAAEDSKLAAAVANAPMADGIAAARRIEPRRLAWGAGMGARDELARLRGQAPVYMPMTAPVGGMAAMTADDAHRGYARIVPERSTWQNRMAARLMLRFPLYRPVRGAAGIRCPILVCICDRDGITPPEPAARVAADAPRGEARHYGGGHFDIYVDELFEQASADQTEFLVRNLQP